VVIANFSELHQRGRVAGEYRVPNWPARRSESAGAKLRKTVSWRRSTVAPSRFSWRPRFNVLV